MKLEEMLSPELCDFSGRKIKDKEELFQSFAELFYNAGKIRDKEVLVQELLEREKLGSTYMGLGLALPHAGSDTVVENAMAVIRCQPFLYESDGAAGNVEIALAMIVGNEESEEVHLKMLANISRVLVKPEFFNALKTENDFEKLLEVGNRQLGEIEGFDV